jgi:hypothetical protein
MISFTMNGIEYRSYDHIYAVSRCGKVLRQLQPYTPIKHSMGYLSLGRQRLMHRVVAACWLEGFTPDKHIHHINGNKTDNRAENLECLTAKEHMAERHLGINGHYTRTEVTRQKLRDFRTGFKDTEEVRLVKAAILRDVCPKTQCLFQDILYPSVAAAARVMGIHPTTFRQRCNSKNFPDYKWV